VTLPVTPQLLSPIWAIIVLALALSPVLSQEFRNTRFVLDYWTRAISLLLALAALSAVEPRPPCLRVGSDVGVCARIRALTCNLSDLVRDES
jgi:hypothetical protein